MGYTTHGSLTNFGTILAKYLGVFVTYGGSVTNGSATDRTALISSSKGGRRRRSLRRRPAPISVRSAAVSLSKTVVNFGTITGTVKFTGYAGSRLVVQSGSTILGLVFNQGGTLELASGSGTISGLGSTSAATLSGGATATFRGFGAYAIDAGSSWTLSGTNTLNSGATFTDDGSLTNTGALTLHWTVTGAGSLTFAAGTETINTGAAIGTANWSVTGGTARLNESLTYRGAFSEGAGAVLTVADRQRLALVGSASLGGTLNGAGRAAVSDATLDGFTVGGTMRLRVAGTATQTGTVTIGDATAGAAHLLINKRATYTIDGAAGVARGNASFSSLKVLGTLIKSGATGVSVIAVKTVDDGVIEAATGTLDFANQLTGAGSMKIDAGATLEADQAVASTLTARFFEGDGTLALAQPARFAATIHGFGVHRHHRSVEDGGHLRHPGRRRHPGDQERRQHRRHPAAGRRLYRRHLQRRLGRQWRDERHGDERPRWPATASSPPWPASGEAATDPVARGQRGGRAPIRPCWRLPGWRWLEPRPPQRSAQPRPLHRFAVPLPAKSGGGLNSRKPHGL